MTSNYLKVGRDPGWIELFFDLAFVIILGRMAHMLFHTHDGSLDIESLIIYVWIFSIMFLVWVLFTVYMNIYGDDSFWQTLCGFSLMAGLMVIAMLMNDSVKNSGWIAVTVSLMCLILAFMYNQTKNVVESNKRYASYKIKSLLILATGGLALSLTSAVIPGTFLLYFIERAIDERILRRIGMTKPDSEHLVERIGIFMIILIGESFITLVDNIPNQFNLKAALMVMMIMILLFSIFINYYTIIEQMAELSHNNYSEVMFSNLLVMTSMTVLPAVIYHSIKETLVMEQFNPLVCFFTFTFVFGNALTYNKSPDRNIVANIFYPLILPIIFCIIIYVMPGYFLTMLGMVIIFIVTSIMVLKYRQALDNR